MAGITGISSISSISSGLSTRGVSGISPTERAGTANIGTAGSNGGASFMDTLQSALGQLNSNLSSADSMVSSFAAGGNADISNVMIEMQQASLELKLGTQVRDKLLESYQEIMRLQV